MPNYTAKLNLPLPAENETVSLDNHNALVNAIDTGAAAQADLDAHTSDTNNPHQVTAAQVGAVAASSSAIISTLGYTPANKANTQNVKLTNDDGTPLSIPNNVTELSSVTMPGTYYMSASQSQTFSDHPLPGTSGWWLYVSPFQSISGVSNVFQELIQNVSSNPIRYWRVITAAAASSWSTITQSVNQNILFNPSGTRGLAGWSGSGSWTTYFDAEGSRFVGPDIATAGTSYSLSSLPIPMDSGIVLTASGRIFGTSITAGTAHLSLHAYDSSGNDLGAICSTAMVTTNSDYAYVSTTGQTPANTASVKLLLVQDDTMVGHASFGSLKIERGSIATSFSDDSTANLVQYGAQRGEIDWYNATLQNGWQVYASNDAPAYGKSADGTVFLRGTIKGGAAGTVALTLPAGYRPSVGVHMPVISGASNGLGLGRIYIGTDGTVTVQALADTNYLTLDCSFSSL